jgi:hypothetical protein
VKAWFEHALGGDDPRPADAVYWQIADDLRRLVNRYNNQFLPPEEHRDVLPNDLIGQAHTDVMDAANRLLLSLERLGELLPGGLWNREADGFSYAELADFLRDMGVAGHVREEPKKRPGKPKAGWHFWGHPFSGWVERALREAGYSGNLNRSDRTGVVARIGASMVRHVEGEAGQPETFADAMSGRRKSRALNPQERFPYMNRLKE